MHIYVYIYLLQTYIHDHACVICHIYSFTYIHMYICTVIKVTFMCEINPYVEGWVQTKLIWANFTVPLNHK